MNEVIKEIRIYFNCPDRKREGRGNTSFCKLFNLHCLDVRGMGKCPRMRKTGG